MSQKKGLKILLLYTVFYGVIQCFEVTLNGLAALLEKQSKFQRYYIKVEENLIQIETFRVVSRFPRYISCYVAESRFPLGQCTTNKAIIQ